MKLQDLQLADIRLFVKAIECKSLSVAAAGLQVPRATATRQLQRLESVLGHSLLNRSAGRFSLTDEGRLFLPSAQRLLNELDAAVESLSSDGRPLRGRLRISAPYTFGVSYVAPRIASFIAIHREVDIEVELGSRRVDLLADEADLAVRIGDVGLDALVARRLASERMVVCAAKKYVGNCTVVPQEIDDLSTHRMLVIGLTGSAKELVVRTRTATHRIACTIVMRSNEPAALIPALLEGAGIGIVPRRFVANELEAGVLVELLQDVDLMPLPVNAVYVRGRRNAHKVRAFLDHLALYVEMEKEA